MSLVINNPELEQRIEAISHARGESVELVGSQAVVHFQTQRARQPLTHAEQLRAADVLANIRAEFIQMHADDPRTAEEVLRYNENGLPN